VNTIKADDAPFYQAVELTAHTDLFQNLPGVSAGLGSGLTRGYRSSGQAGGGSGGGYQADLLVVTG
jgi:hypothetical protein